MSFKLSLFSDDGKLMPLANDDEMFILERPGVSFTCTTASGSKFKANGRIYITTQRLVFCADKGTTQHDTFFEAFEIPLDNVRRDKFNQPIFGACNISGDVFPATDQTNYDDVTPIHWKVSFNNGGTGTFLTVFLKLMEQKKKGDIDASFVAKQQQKAFVDPNDPSVIYVTQPVRPPRKPMASC
ncbi:hypothetical protein H257_07328 [Aphanomyces astaci]|uniref:GRAM domain-containing protein n=1 Tax=Aphanomyces astaci TaxID=112090 RepID=W4GK22_APHAT|nr:hypothetical protein H257_07328 [Aphanomyces astaci]ETV79268.1 hypothetical protein H257_07328 [Aphanomyces astaci]|eukprot:XP_009831109.1 hypothetical protein H257_07328 [Aphanomyces astaci]